MERRKLLLCLLTIVVASSGHGQVILNGGFESGQLGPWFIGGNFSDPSENPQIWFVTSSGAHSGSYAVEDVGNIELRQNFAPVATSQIQDVSLWVEQPNEPALSGAYFHYSDGTEQFVRLDPQDTGWDLHDITGDLAPNKFLTGFSFFGYSDGSPDPPPLTMLDDVSVTLVPEANTMTLMGIGAVILAASGSWRGTRKHFGPV